MADFNATIKHLLELLTFENAQIDSQTKDGALEVVLTLSPEDSGILIGFHGEKIDALQLILSLIYNLNQESFTPVRLDINGYRAKRTDVLIELADKATAQALESGREIILPPLSPAERRLVHVHLSQNDQVSTYSEGEGRARRLIIRPQSLVSDQPTS